MVADPNFLVKSCSEIGWVAGMHFASKLNMRGAAGCLTEIDFVVASVLAAIAEKYYLAWKRRLCLVFA